MTAAAAEVETQRIKLAVCGAGRWGRTLAGSIAAHPSVCLAAIISSGTDTAERVSANAPICATWQDAVASTPIDGFVMAVPPDIQPVIAKQLITAGYPVFLEKPLATSREAAQELLGIANERGFVGVVDHIHLFAGEFQQLVRHIPQEAVLSVEALSGSRGPVRKTWTPCWDWAPHDLAMCLAVMRIPPRTVSARIVDDIQDSDGRFQNYEIDLDFGERGRAHIVTGSAFGEYRREFRVSAVSSTWTYSETADRIRALVETKNGTNEALSVSAKPPLDAAIAEFAARITRKSGGLEDLQIAATVVEICAAIENSVASRKAVPLGEK